MFQSTSFIKVMSHITLVDGSRYSHFMNENHILRYQEKGSNAVFQMGSFTQGVTTFLGLQRLLWYNLTLNPHSPTSSICDFKQ